MFQLKETSVLGFVLRQPQYCWFLFIQFITCRLHVLVSFHRLDQDIMRMSSYIPFCCFAGSRECVSMRASFMLWQRFENTHNTISFHQRHARSKCLLMKGSALVWCLCSITVFLCLHVNARTGTTTPMCLCIFVLFPTTVEYHITYEHTTPVYNRADQENWILLRNTEAVFACLCVCECACACISICERERGQGRICYRQLVSNIFCSAQFNVCVCVWKSLYYFNVLSHRMAIQCPLIRMKVVVTY